MAVPSPVEPEKVALGPASQFRSPAMHTSVSSRRRDRTAIGSSIALHVCALAVLLAAVRLPSFPTQEPDERVLLASVVHVRQPAAVPQRRAVPRAATVPVPVRQPQAVVTPGPLHVTVTTERAHRALVVAAEARYVPPASPAQPPRAHAVPVAAPVLVAVRHEAAATAAPVAAATAAPVVVAAATPAPASAEREMGQGNFGESYPARPMPGMLDALRAKIAHLVARVTVDERGHAVSVVVVAGADDAAQREEITRALLAATYIPASCNGLSCAQTFDLRT